MNQQSPVHHRRRELLVCSIFRAYSPGDLTGGERLVRAWGEPAGDSLRQMHLPGVDTYFDDTLSGESYWARMLLPSIEARAHRPFKRIKFRFYPIATLQH